MKKSEPKLESLRWNPWTSKRLGFKLSIREQQLLISFQPLPPSGLQNGSELSKSNGYNMSPLTNFMILEIVVDDTSTNPKTNYKIGRNDGYSLDVDVSEILAFNEVLTTERVPCFNI